MRVRIAVHALIALFSLLPLSLAAWSAEPRFFHVDPPKGKFKSVRFSSFKLDNEDYLLGVLSSFKLPEDDGHTPGLNDEVTEATTRILEASLRKGYVDAGVPPEFVDRIMKEEPFDDGRSEVVFVTRMNEPEDVQAMLRYAFSTPENPDLPLEKRLKIRIKKPHPVRRPYVEEGKGISTLWEIHRPEADYGIPFVERLPNRVELKSLWKNEKARRNFLPLIWQVSEGGREISRRKIPLRSEKEYWLQAEAAIRGEKPFPPENQFYPDNYLLESEDLRARLYRGWGFEAFQNLRVPDPHYPGAFANVMTISREGFSNLGQKLEARKGKPIFSGDFGHSDFLKKRAGNGGLHPPVSYVGHLLGPKWYPSECVQRFKDFRWR